jgi:Ca2+-binding EF-hand superfamily protein
MEILSMMGKTIWITSSILAATVGMTAVAAHAERSGSDERGFYRDHGGYSEYGNRGRSWRGRWRREMTKAEFDAKTRSKFSRLDANGDGVVDQSEAEARISDRMARRMRGARGNRMARRLRRFDTDGDGKITKVEIEAIISKRFARIDLDGNGKITDADLPPRMRGRKVLSGESHVGGMHKRGRRGHRRGGRMMRHVFGTDANKDGAVTLQEMQDRGSKGFARFDHNSDGVIDKADRETMGAKTKAYRVKRFFHRYAVADGKLTIEQFTKHRNERFAQKDRDGDGIIERRSHRGGWGRRGHGRDWRRDCN